MPIASVATEINVAVFWYKLDLGGITSSGG